MNYNKLQDTDVDMKNEKGVWIGDPCYVVPEELWGSFCNAWMAYEKKHEDLPRCYIAETHDEYSGRGFYSWSTAYGDGCYQLYVNNEPVAKLGVDAGCLAAIPVELLDEWNKRHGLGDFEGLGHVVESKHLHGEIVMDGGDLFWGDVRLPTGGSVDDEEDEYAECEEEGFFF